jgi:hypothetical protein
MTLKRTKTTGLLAVGAAIGALQIACWPEGALPAIVFGRPLRVAPVQQHSPIVVSSGTRVRVPLRLKNLAGRATELRARRLRCMPAFLEGVPPAIGAWETADIMLAVNTVNLNGRQTVAAVISTDQPSQPEVPVSVTIEVHADVVQRRIDLGPHLAGAEISGKLVRIQDVPAQDFSHFGDILPEGWVAQVARASGRTLDIRLSGKVTPGIVDSGHFEVQFDVYFSGEEVRRARVSAHSQVVSRWVIPEELLVDALPAFRPDSLSFAVWHYADEHFTRVPSVEASLGPRLSHARLRITGPVREELGDLNRFRFEVTAGPTEQDLAGESAKLQLVGSDGGSEVVTIPVVGMSAKGSIH